MADDESGGGGGGRILQLRPRQHAAKPAVVDLRRISEQDPDYRALHAATTRELWAGLHAFARRLATSAPHAHGDAVSLFVRHQIDVLQRAYMSAHAEGERDYWQTVSQQGQTRAGARALSRTHGVSPDHHAMARTLSFYATVSLPKMAREGQLAAQAAMTRPLAEVTRLGDAGAPHSNKGLPAPLQDWLGGLTARVDAQAEIVWPALQNGYFAAGNIDPANPYAQVAWELEPSADHCDDCPRMAAGSPYTAPGSGGGNELWTTPGDGNTACGGGCKCTLRYVNVGAFASTAAVGSASVGTGPTGSASSAPDTSSSASTSGASTDGAPPPPAAPAPPDALSGPTAPPALTALQQRALDALRGVAATWDRVRGSLPPIGEFVQDPSMPPRAQLTPAQQQALDAFEAALLAYEALFEDTAVIDPLAALDDEPIDPQNTPPPNG